MQKFSNESLKVTVERKNIYLMLDADTLSEVEYQLIPLFEFDINKTKYWINSTHESLVFRPKKIEHFSLNKFILISFSNLK